MQNVERRMKNLDQLSVLLHSPCEASRRPEPLWPCQKNVLGFTGQKGENASGMALTPALRECAGALEAINLLFRRSSLLRAVLLGMALWLFEFPPSATAGDAIAYWTFDESNGSAALDLSGNGHDATITGAAYITGISNYALAFNGSNAYVFASDALVGGTSGAGLDAGTRDWTVAAWIKTTASGMVVTKMGWIGGSNPDGWGMSVSGNGTLGAALHKSNAGTVNIFAGDGKIVNDGQWHHIAVVFNRSGNMIRFVDGVSTGTQNDLTFIAGESIDNTRQLRIGARDQAGDEVFFNGLIDDVHVYARGLSPAEIAGLAGVPPPPQPLWS